MSYVFVTKIFRPKKNSRGPDFRLLRVEKTILRREIEGFDRELMRFASAGSLEKESTARNPRPNSPPRGRDGFTRQARMLVNDSLDRLVCGKAIENAPHGDTRSGNDRLAHHDIGAGFDEVHGWKPTR